MEYGSDRIWLMEEGQGWRLMDGNGDYDTVVLVPGVGGGWDVLKRYIHMYTVYYIFPFLFYRSILEHCYLL